MSPVPFAEDLQLKIHVSFPRAHPTEERLAKWARVIVAVSVAGSMASFDPAYAQGDVAPPVEQFQVRKNVMDASYLALLRMILERQGCVVTQADIEQGKVIRTPGDTRELQFRMALTLAPEAIKPTTVLMEMYRISLSREALRKPLEGKEPPFVLAMLAPEGGWGSRFVWLQEFEPELDRVTYNDAIAGKTVQASWAEFKPKWRKTLKLQFARGVD